MGLGVWKEVSSIPKGRSWTVGTAVLILIIIVIVIIIISSSK